METLARWRELQGAFWLLVYLEPLDPMVDVAVEANSAKLAFIKGKYNRADNCCLFDTNKQLIHWVVCLFVCRVFNSFFDIQIMVI